MIKNDQQCKAAKEKLALLEESSARGFGVAVPDVVQETRDGQLRSLIAEIRKEIERYERSRSAGTEIRPARDQGNER